MQKLVAVLVLVFATSCNGSPPTRDVNLPSQGAAPPIQAADALIPPTLTSEQQHIVDQVVQAKIRALFDNADTVEVLAIVPCGESLNRPPYIPRTGLLGCEIQRVYTARDPEDKRQVRDVFYYGIAVAGSPAACWGPHHGLRVQKGKAQLDIAICFDCGHFHGVWGGQNFYGSISAQAESMFDRFLERGLDARQASPRPPN